MNLPIEKMTREDLKQIKVICFDGDGVTKKKGTDFLWENGQLVLESYPPTEEIKEKLIELSKYFHVTFSSGRAMQYLKNIYPDELMGEKVSLQAEIGMYLYYKKLLVTNYQLPIKAKEKLENIRTALKKIIHPDIRGFEPKEYLITLHCSQAIQVVEKIVKESDPENELFCWWNEEAYDIGVKGINKATGLKKLLEKVGWKMENVMTVGNGINDENMTKVGGITVSTDPIHLNADFVVTGEEKGGERVVNRILELI